MAGLKLLQIQVSADLKGLFIRRYKRFFADIKVSDGSELTVHCPNPGSMRDLLRESAPVWCTTSKNPKRKLKHTLEMIEIGNVWVGLHTIRANQIAKCILEKNFLESLSDYPEIKSEVRVGENSRLDFVLSGNFVDPRTTYVEVKSVTMSSRNKALFPDSVTRRGKKHAELLSDLSRKGNRAVLMFIIQRSDCDVFSIADDIDPNYGKSLRKAIDNGVEVFAIRTHVTPSAIRIDSPIQVEF
tara:strand:- start:1921 stop:2646 length:726 start_codon:yes stop_codon:yes gene_type:complete